MKTVLQVFLMATLSFYSCGRNFDYDADEFKNLQESAKNFEKISDAEIMSIVDDMTNSKMSSMSTQQMREAFAAVAGALAPQNLGAIKSASLALGGPYTALSCAEKLKLESETDPCQDVNNVRQGPLTCRAKHAAYYLRRFERQLCQIEDNLKDSSKALLFVLGASTVNGLKDGSSEDACKFGNETPKGAGPKALNPVFEALLPERLKRSYLYYKLGGELLESGSYANSCQKRANVETNTGKKRFALLVGQTAESDQIYSLVKVNPAAAFGSGTTISGLDTIPSRFYESGKLKSTTNLYEVYINGKKAKIKHATDSTIGDFTLVFTDANNFWFRAVINAIESQTDMIATPTNVAFIIDVNNGKWNARLAEYIKPFVSATTTPTGTSEAAHVYTDMTANSSGILARLSTFAYDTNLSSEPSSLPNIKSHCTNVSSTCTSGTIKITGENPSTAFGDGYACITPDLTSSVASGYLNLNVTYLTSSLAATSSGCNGLLSTEFAGSDFANIPWISPHTLNGTKVTTNTVPTQIGNMNE